MAHTRITRTRSTRTLRLTLAFIFSLSLVWAMLPGSLQSFFVPAASAAGLTFTVTNTNNAGAGSLRQAILDANAAPGTDTIKFAVGSGLVFIKPTAALPFISSPVVIDGTTQPGYTEGQPVVYLDGSATGGGLVAGLYITAGNSTVKGLAINRFSGAGIGMESNGGNKIKGCHIGNVGLGGGNAGDGIYIGFTSLHSIGGTSAADRNVISGNGGSGVYINGGAANSVVGNYIGTDAEGNGDYGNVNAGVLIASKSNTNNIGSASPGGRNVISGNAHAGISLQGAGAGNVIYGNYVGTNAAGDKGVANQMGIRLVESPNTLIGNGKPEGRNVVSGNQGSGIMVDNSSGTVVKGNYIGTGANGQLKLTNYNNGITVTGGSANCAIGGPGTEGNVIAGNSQHGVEFASNPAATGNKIQGNRIGVGATGQALGNGGSGNAGSGVVIFNSSGVLIGDPTDDNTSAPLANVIAHNDGHGVRVSGDGSSGNSILANSIHSNGNLGIDLTGDGDFGVTPNDSGDSDAGPNGLQNSPKVGMATVGAGLAKFQVSLQSEANKAYVVHLYSAPGCDPSGHGEGDKLIYSSTPTLADGDGALSFNYSTSGQIVSVGQFITATATAADGSTSEFSKCVVVSKAVAPDSVQFGGAGLDVAESAKVAHIPVTRTGSTSAPATVNYATSEDFGIGARAPVDYTATSGTLTFAPGETSKTISVEIKEDFKLEMDEWFHVVLSDPTGVTLGSPSMFKVTIENSAPPQLTASVGDATVTEGNGGMTDAQFTVTLSAVSSQSVSVLFSTADATAQAGSDYIPLSGTITFAAGETSKTIAVPVKGDTDVEADETFSVNLSAVGEQATVADGQGVCTVNNDDTEPALKPTPAPNTFQFSQAQYAAQEDSSHVTVTVTRTGDTSAPASVEYATQNDTATERSEFTTAVGTLRFAADETSKSFDILLTEDFSDEADEESFSLILSNPAGAALGQQSAASVKVTDDAYEPAANANDDAELFVRQHYHDFLGREADPAGLAFWTNDLLGCGSDASCLGHKRQNVSAAFFLSIEFQETGFLVHRLTEASFDRLPRYRDFVRDSREVAQGVVVGQGDWEQQLEANRRAFFDAWVARAEFRQKYDPMSNEQYVEALFQNAGVTPSTDERLSLVAGLDSAAETRAAVLRKVTDGASFKQAEKNRAFVLMQYFGYLRRDPDAAPDSDMSGYNFWLQKLVSHDGDFVRAEMVKAFLDSSEYRGRFGQ